LQTYCIWILLHRQFNLYPIPPHVSEDEAYALVKLFEAEKTKSASLKKTLCAVAGISAAVILILGASVFGAVFVAVQATKDTQVSDSGALMTKDGSRKLTTVAHGTTFQLFNTSDDTPLCVSLDL
jgi:hypothetical protein